MFTISPYTELGTAYAYYVCLLLDLAMITLLIWFCSTDRNSPRPDHCS
jgi:hypothetical protein